MIEDLVRLSAEDLHQVALALRTGRLRPPYGGVALRRLVATPEADALAVAMRELDSEGFAPTQLSRMLDLIAADRRSRPVAADLIELVWTGPETTGIANRDTGVVVRELFGHATEAVLVAGYAVYQGHRIFRELADRMEATPGLRVRLYLDIRRDRGDDATAAEVVRRFARRFVDQVWPGRRFPEVFYDPRALEADPARRASLHAKCVVVDAERSLISSANFTEAAQLRNLEVGVLIRSRPLASRIVQHFETLALADLLKPIELTAET